MASGFHLDPDAQAKLDALADEFLANTVLPKMVDKAKRIVPVESGDLQRSIGSEQEGHHHYLVATENYAAWVELGTSKMHAQPYLRPAAMTTLEGL